MNPNNHDEDSMSFLLNLLTRDNQQDELMTDANAADVQQQQQHSEHSEHTSLEDIEPSLDLFEYPPAPVGFDALPPPTTVFSIDGNNSGGAAAVGSVSWQQMQQQDPQQAGAAFQQYRNHSSCSSYSNFSSSVPSVASTPSLLSGINTPAHPREWSRGAAYVTGSSISASAVAVVSVAAGSSASAIDPDENRRRFADVNSLSRQELYDTISSRLMRVGSGSTVGFGGDSASPSAANSSEAPESPRWQQQQQQSHHHHRHHHSGGSASASSATSIVVSGASTASAVDSSDVDPATVGGEAHLKDEPATPPSTPSRLPRHQREPHKKAEKKRVEKIRQRLDQLRELCGSGGGADRSEAKLLSRVLTFLRELQAANRRAGDEAALLQAKLTELEAEQKQLLEDLNNEDDVDAAIDEGFGAVKLESDGADEDADMASENTITHDYRHQLGSQVALQQKQQQQQQQQLQDHAVRHRQSEAASLSAGLSAYCQDRLGSTDRSVVLFHRLVGDLLVDSFRQSVLPQTPVANGNASEASSASASMPDLAFRSNVQRWLASLTISRLRRDVNQKLNEVAVEFL